MERLILSIDPSVRELGFAALQISPDKSRQWWWGLIKPEGDNYVAKLFDICEMLIQFLPIPLDSDHIELVTEWPQFFNNARGHTAAVQGDTLLLAGVNAFIIGYFQLRKTTLRTAVEWKGSVPKQVTIRRFLKRFDQKWHDLNHNIVDAIMILHDHCIRNNYIPDTHDLTGDTCTLLT
mgnify:CR=1 FL=1